MKTAKFDFYRELMNRTSPDGNPLHDIFWRHDGGLSNYNFSKVAPDFSELSNNLYFAIQEEPPGAENSYFCIAVYDYESRKDPIKAYIVYFKAYRDRDALREALQELRAALDQMQEDIYYNRLDISQ